MPESGKALPYAVRAAGLALCALALATLLLLLTGVNVLRAWWEIVRGAFGTPAAWSWTVMGMTPILLTALSAAFAQRAGLFNAGIEGQYIVGLVAAALMGTYVDFPRVLHPLFCMAAAMLAAGVYGVLTGYLKAAFGIHELLSGALLTWIAFYGHNLLLELPALLDAEGQFPQLQASAGTVILEQWPLSEAAQQGLNSVPIASELFTTPVHWGILLALLALPIVGFFLRRSRIAYDMRAVALGPMAARQAGIPVRSRLMQASGWAGAMAGLAAAVQLLGPTMPHQLTTLQALPGYGLSGLGAAYLGGFSMPGILASGLGLAALGEGSQAAGVPEVWYMLVVGLLLLLCALPRMERKPVFRLPRKVLQQLTPGKPEKRRKKPNKVRR